MSDLPIKPVTLESLQEMGLDRKDAAFIVVLP